MPSSLSISATVPIMPVFTPPPVIFPDFTSEALVAISADRSGMQDFFSLHGLTYLSGLRFKNKHIRVDAEIAAENCTQAMRQILAYGLHRNGGEEQELIDVMRKEGDDLQYNLSPDLGIAVINERVGFGCFALSDMKQGELIGEYTGYVSTMSLLSGTNMYCMSSNPWHEMVRRFARRFQPFLVVDAQKGGNETRFINHIPSELVLSGTALTAANVELFSSFSAGLFHVLLQTSRDISAGEELRFDYGPSYWSRHQDRDESRVYRLCENSVCAVPTILR
jgi:hypothetical protein